MAPPTLFGSAAPRASSSRPRQQRPEGDRDGSNTNNNDDTNDHEDNNIDADSVDGDGSSDEPTEEQKRNEVTAFLLSQVLHLGPAVEALKQENARLKSENKVMREELRELPELRAQIQQILAALAASSVDLPGLESLSQATVVGDSASACSRTKQKKSVRWESEPAASGSSSASILVEERVRALCPILPLHSFRCSICLTIRPYS